jgi:hypothetical protein
MPLPSGEAGEFRSAKRRMPIEPFARVVDSRELSCGQCGGLCRYDSASGHRPESPEFLKPAHGVWLYFSVDPVSDTLVVGAACSEECMNLLRG